MTPALSRLPSAACRIFFREKGKSTPTCLDTVSALLATSSDRPLHAIARALVLPKPFGLTAVLITAFSHFSVLRGGNDILQYLICLGWPAREC